MSNETSPDASPSPAKVQPEVRKLNDYERRMMKAAGFKDEDLDPINLRIGVDAANWSKDTLGKASYDNIEFREGAYTQDSANGLALLAHEIQHSYQYRNGLTQFENWQEEASKGYKNNKYEKDANRCEDDAYQFIQQERLEEYEKSIK